MTIYRLTAACAFLLALTANATARNAIERRWLVDARFARCHGKAKKPSFAPEPWFRETINRSPAAELAEAIVAGRLTLSQCEFSVAEIDALLACFDSLRPTQLRDSTNGP